MKIVFWVIVVVILVITIDFVMTNGQPVQFGSWFLPWQTEIPAGLAVLLALALGLLVGGFMAWTAGHQARRRARAAEREVEHLQRELSMLLRRAEHAERDAVALPEPSAGNQDDPADGRDAVTGGGRT